MTLVPPTAPGIFPRQQTRRRKNEFDFALEEAEARSGHAPDQSVLSNSLLSIEVLETLSKMAPAPDASAVALAYGQSPDPVQYELIPAEPVVEEKKSRINRWHGTSHANDRRRTERRKIERPGSR